MQSRKPTKGFLCNKIFFYLPTKTDRQLSASDSCDTSEMQGLLAEEVGKSEGDFYSLLGCHPSSSDEQILTEYRIRAKELHPDRSADVEKATADFQEIQAAKETLLDRTRRRLYDRWRDSGVKVPFTQWEAMKDAVQTGMHWATPRQDRMVSKECKNGPKENSKHDETDHLESEKEKGPENSSREGPHQFNSSAHEGSSKRGLGPRQDSVHPTFLMVNKCDHNELRRKFRNYEI